MSHRHTLKSHHKADFLCCCNKLIYVRHGSVEIVPAQTGMTIMLQIRKFIVMQCRFLSKHISVTNFLCCIRVCVCIYIYRERERERERERFALIILIKSVNSLIKCGICILLKLNLWPKLWLLLFPLYSDVMYPFITNGHCKEFQMIDGSEVYKVVFGSTWIEMGLPKLLHTL